ncbi:unnamed protein product [Dovyalis caffra]|uniref:Uncharacterized protein n=1 Tax=Dovyalis caffra TaxID=77055 RepID=A0AAV1S125_9ROSI|nr:unnamed protein product [Dovyalis caffra]
MLKSNLVGSGCYCISESRVFGILCDSKSWHSVDNRKDGVRDVMGGDLCEGIFPIGKASSNRPARMGFERESGKPKTDSAMLTIKPQIN